MSTPSTPAAPQAPARLSLAREIGLVSVVTLLGVILALHGWHAAAPGRPNTSAAALQAMRPDASALAVLPVAALVPLGIGLLCGLINGALIVGLNLHPFIVTLGTMSIFRGLANVLPPQKTLPAAGRRLPAAFTTHFMRVELFRLSSSLRHGWRAR